MVIWTLVNNPFKHLTNQKLAEKLPIPFGEFGCLNNVKWHFMLLRLFFSCNRPKRKKQMSSFLLCNKVYLWLHPDRIIWNRITVLPAPGKKKERKKISSGMQREAQHFLFTFYLPNFQGGLQVRSSAVTDQFPMALI